MIKLFTQHRYLLWQFTKRQIEQRHKGSFLGIIWSILQPLAMMLIYTVVFGIIFRGNYDGIANQTTMDYAIGVFLSISIYQVMAEVIMMSASAITTQPNLVKKVVFPLEILPLANLGVAFYQFAISLTLVLAGLLTIGQGLSLHSMWFPIVLLPLLPLCLGISLLLSSIGVFLRDIQHATGPLTMVLLYASAVFYSTTMIPYQLWAFLRLNPLVHIIEQSRHALLWDLPIDWISLGYSMVFSFVILGVGIWTFGKLRPSFADVL